jgi:GDP-L-fucose synthase
VYHAAGRVGGIEANIEFPADMIAENLAIQSNVVHQCARARAKLLFLGSSCIYPVLDRPITEADFMTGPLEPTNRAYAVAKIAGIEMCRAYGKQYGLRSVILMPCNLYGPGRPNDTHVVNQLMRRFHAAKLENAPSVVVWGDGTALRELMHVDDLAEACVELMAQASAEAPMVNVGTGIEHTIAELAYMLADVVGYMGPITFDTSKPSGVHRKVLNCSLATRLRWRARTHLREGLERTYAEMLI